MQKFTLTFLGIILFVRLSTAQDCNSADVWNVENDNAYCFEVNSNVRHIYANNYPDHSDDYNQPQFTVTAQDYEYYMCAYPVESSDYTPLYEETETSVGCEYNYKFGVAINGVRYDPSSAVTFVKSDGSNNIDWHVEATSTENTIGQNMGTLNGGHRNSKGEYHYHAVPYDYFVNDLGIDGSEHSPIIGYAADGFPVYYKYVYTDAEDDLSAITAASSGYTMKNGSRGGDGLSAPDGDYDGNYYEDYEYNAANSILDKCNGRYGVTPDYPYGTYYYVLTDEYPYIPRCFKGTSVDNSFRIGPSAACPSSTASTSCSAEVSGCMDPFSDSYNPDANADNGSCTYSAVTWSGSWSNSSGPGDAQDATINADYYFGNDGKFSCNNLTISANATLYLDSEDALVVYGDVINNGNIYIQSGGSLITYSGKSWTGNPLTITRNTRYSDGKYSFVGSPMQQTGDITGADLGSAVYYYDETETYADQGLNRWKSAANVVLEPGKGYTQAFKQTLTFSGTPNTGTINVTGTFTDRTNDNVEGWLFLSNPYPAAISVKRFLAENTNISGSIYLWDDNNSAEARGSNADYIIANALATTQSSQAGNDDRYNEHIGAMQGFFVKLNSASDIVVTFTESMRVSDSNEDNHFFRSAADANPIARINLSNAEGLFKQTVIGRVAGIDAHKINRLYDAPAISADAENVIFTTKNGAPLAIQGISYQQNQVPLVLSVATAGWYTIQTDDHSDLPLLLYDRQTNTTTPLAQGYSFYADQGKIDNRFVVTVNTSTILSAIASNQQVFSMKQNSLCWEYGTTPPASVISLYSLSGQIINRWSASQSGEMSLEGISPGVYIVSDGVHRLKTIIR